MINKLLLSPIEYMLIIVVAIVIVFFLYVIINNVIRQAIIDSRSKKIEKLNKKATALGEEGSPTNSENTKEEKTKKKDGNDVYNNILEKVHQNRELYYKDLEIKQEPIKEIIKNDKFEFDSSKMPKMKGDFDFKQLGLFEDFDFDSKELNDFGFNELLADEKEDFRAEMKRKRSIKRNLTIGQEINKCSDRIKAILLLDIINKKPWD